MKDQKRGVITFHNLDRAEKPCLPYMQVTILHFWLVCP